MKPETTTDNLIRQRIKALPPTPVRGWEALAARLNAGAATGIADSTADALVAEKLTALAPVAPAGSWEAFAEKLATAEATTTETLDELVSTGLRQSAPATVSGWALLAARLETIGKRREMVGCIKVTEAAFLLSMLLLYVQFAPVATTTDRPALASLPATPTLPLAELPPVATTTPTVANAPTGEMRAAATSPRGNDRSVTLLPTLTPEVDWMRSRTSGTTVVPRTSATEASPLSLPEAVAPHRLTTAAKPALRLPTVETPDPIRYYLNAFVSPLDLNEIITQEERSLGIYDQKALSTGMSGGLLINVMQGKNGIETGFIYGYRSYVPAEILQLQSWRRNESEDRVRYGRLEYHTVSVPLNYERVLSRTDNWQVTAGIGAAANLILSSEFRLYGDFTREDLARQIEDFRQDPVIKRRGLAKSSSSDAGRHSILYPDAGSLQGGLLVENTSLYLSGSLRVERLLDNRWSLYFSPTVSRLFAIREDAGGKGPLQDRIHNTMLRLGTRYRLTDK